MKKPSFLERLTGVGRGDDYDDMIDDEFEETEPDSRGAYREDSEWPGHKIAEEQQEGELPVDMFQTPDSIVIRALVAGVLPDDLDISITRDMVTIRGRREESREVADEDYYHHELFWGGFTRTLVLPEEVLIDEAEAKEKHGLLEIVLPKVDKDRSTRLKVRSGA
ncbi:MAG: Hsp20/alpha crystallin family protein, partial [Candidatus Paceibacterota bacterium]